MSAHLPTDQLLARRAALLAETPFMVARDIAAKLGISEAELLALGSEDMTVTRLRADWRDIIAGVPAFGRVMALTRNESAVHERKGVYGKLGGNSHIGLIVGEDIDLRIFFSHWKTGFAVARHGKDGIHRSLQFFDAQGAAIHKIHLLETSDADAFDALVTRFAAPAAPVEISEPAAPRKTVSDSDADVAGFRAAWDGLKDTHEFHGLLLKYNLGRHQALRLAGEGRAEQVDLSAFRTAVETAKESQVPFMVFVGNTGMIQIHTGTVDNLLATGPWFNIMDERFNLHLREDHIASAWVVWKPTSEGIVTSLEVFDTNGSIIATLFGKRKPGDREDEAWRTIVNNLPEREAA